MRVNRRALNNTVDGYKLIRSVGHGKKSGTVGERRDTADGVEAGFQEPGAHFELRSTSGDVFDVTTERNRYGDVFGRAGGFTFLYGFNIQSDAVGSGCKV